MIMIHKIIILLFITLISTSCKNIYFGNDKIKGQAVIVDNFIDKNPLEDLYIEVVYTRDEGHSYNYLSNSTTDKNGYFEINTKFKSANYSTDSWAIANIYSNSDYADSLGSFNFQFPANKFDYKTIHLDTFSLSHNIWIIPRIKSLGTLKPDEISIDFYNCELVDTSFRVVTYNGSIDLYQEFSPVEITMSMNIQHWLSYGSGELAIGSLKIDSEEIGFGYFKLEQPKYTTEGDTVYLDFDIKEYD